MKKTRQSAKKKHGNKKKVSASNNKGGAKPQAKVPVKKPVAPMPNKSNRKKTTDKKGADAGTMIGYIGLARQFLREAKIELKKVKWPTRKELLASTAVVIFLSLFMALYFWLVDSGLMLIIKNVLT